ncbi:acyl-CoA N-acyltransferase [Plectosphaerella plurivora]|uniref:Acyl-CoA N-acyltransferase n=1 Tax=Plectosphaerella plurivora TaxID=936078 RepID=A0A9P8V276_9PEZI|nr:acyl-CoA N-acyltransferase [Plectosphaerella plurivora]
MTTPSTFRLEHTSVEDVPALTELWYAAFTAPYIRELWPDTPGVRQWWNDTHRHDFLTKPFQRYVKIIDTETLDDQGKPRLVAWAKWDLAMPDERGERYPAWHEDQAAEKVDAVMGTLEKNRRRVMGAQKHYYLDTLATHPDYHRRGAASMLIKWGCDLADKDGVGAYVDASKAGAPLYARFGFVDASEPNGGSIAPMSRQPVSSKA